MDKTKRFQTGKLIKEFHQSKVDIEQLTAYITEFGTPIIGETDTQDEMREVVYVYVAKNNVKQDVYAIIPDKYHASITESKLTQLEGSPIYYRIEKVPNDIYISYMFCIHDDPKIDVEELWKYGQRDENCKGVLTFQEGEEKTYRSYFQMPFAKNRLQDEIGNITCPGTLEDMSSTYAYQMYLPYEYNKEEHYPLLLLNDGVAYLHTMQMKELLDYNIQEGVIPKIMVCFIHNQDRISELTCNDKFAKFIVYGLLEDVQKHYCATRLMASDVIIGGLSVGGLMAMYIGYHYSDVIANVISESGSFWWGTEKPQKDGKYQNDMLERFQKTEKLDLNIYMTIGVAEDQNMMRVPNDALYAYLQQKGYHIAYHVFPSAHDYLWWGDEVIKGIKFLRKY